MACPFSSTAKDLGEIDESPSMEEYKKLRRTMGIVTQFYRDGTKLKRGHYDTITQEIARLDTDLQMLDEQMAVLDSDPSFAGHPKQSAFKRELTAERANLVEQRNSLTAKQKEYQELYLWSEDIVRVCEWLELNLDTYCSKTLGLPLKNVTPPPELTEEQKKKYGKGLDEIHHNLEESQDFFLASIDGRLNKFHQIEEKMIEAQLRVIQKYPEDSPRRKVVQNELEQELEFVRSNMVETPDGMKRREKMLKAHAEFFKVLTYHKEKLGVLPREDEPENADKPKYDPKFDIWFQQ